MADIGGQLRNLRKAKGLTLEDISGFSDVSVGLISQIERGRGNPSVSTLVQLAHALDYPFARLFVGADERASPVVRRGERRKLSTDDPTGTIYELLTPSLDHAVEVVWLEVAPGSNTASTPFRHAGEEVGVILQGQHIVWLDGVSYKLEPGDTITYASTTPHWYENPGPETVHAIWIISPPTF